MFRNFFGRKNAVLLLYLVFLSIAAQGQNYPVQVSVSLNPPYSNLLAHYIGDAQALQIQLLHKDFATPETEVFLEFKLEGAGLTLQSSSNGNVSGRFQLLAGVPQSISGVDISDVLSPENLEFQGISKAEFLRSGSKLPQGIYEFSFRAKEVATGLPVSNWGKFQVALYGHLPPIINTPAEGAEINAQNPQYLNIQYTPRHTASPALAGNVQYKIRLIELIPANRNPNEAMQSMEVPLYETFSDQTFIMYGPAEPTLTVGRSYALQVQAIDVNGGDLFENDGYSQVVSFVYGNRCAIPDSFHLASLVGTEAQLAWKSNEQHRAFFIEYRQKNRGEWMSEMVFTNGYQPVNLKPGVVYESRIKGVCAESESLVSKTIDFVTDTARSAFEKWALTSCGKPLPSINLKNRKPLALLEAGDILYAADFEVKILSSTGSAGRFSGNGWVTLPYTGKVPIPCSFESVFINEEYRLLEGKIQVLRKPLELSNRSLVSLAKNWRETFGDNWNVYDERHYDGEISKLSLGDNGVKIEGNGGNLVLPLGKNYELADGSGNVYYISSGGKITAPEGKKMQPPIVANVKTGEGMPSRIETGISKVFFSAQANSGYDGYHIRNLTAGNNYDKLDCNDTAYYAGWKLLKCGVTDSVVAEITIGRKININPDSVHFARSDGTLVPARRAGDFYYLAVTGRMHLYADALWAFAYTDFESYGGPKRQILGKLNLINTDLRKMHIALVPVNGNGENLESNSLESKLNAMMGGQGLEYSVSKAKNLLVPGMDPNEKVEVNREMLGTSYGADLSKIIAAYETREPWVADYRGSDTAYMFVLAAAAHGEAGYMALNRNYGFLFLENGGGTPQTVAHESGHGLGSLEHVFTDISEAGATQNLMDYSPPYALLNRDQWLRLFDYKRVNANDFRLSQSAAVGKMMRWKLYTLKELGLPSSGLLDFVAPDGKVLTLSADSLEGVSFSRSWIIPTTYFWTTRSGAANGVLTRFRYGGIDYGSYLSGKNFMAFYQDNDPKKRRFDNTYYYRNNGKLSRVVFAGFEDSSCHLVVKNGNYRNTNTKDTSIAWVDLTTADVVSTVDLGEDCLEFFTEDELSPAAKKWWTRAKVNQGFTGNEAVCKRIVRLINDLGSAYKYFDLESYRQLLAEKKPKVEPPFTDPLEPFDSKSLRGFENYLRASFYSLRDHEKALGNIENAQHLGSVLSTIPPEIQEQFSLAFRFRLLRKLVNARLTNDYLSYGFALARSSDNETVVLNLLSSSPENQISDLLDSLLAPVIVNKQPHMLAALSEDIDGLDGDEYYQFATQMLQWVSKYRPNPSGNGMVAAVENNSVIQYHSGLFSGTVSYEFTQEGKVKLELQRILSTTVTRVAAGPYDWVYVKFHDDFEFGTHTFKENNTIRLPVYFVSAIFNLDNKNRYKTTGKLALDGALFMMGVGEVRMLLAGANTLSKAFAVGRALADLGFSLGDIAMTAGLGDVLNKTVQGQQFLDRWNTIQLYYGIGSVAESGLSAVIYKLYGDYKALKMWDGLDAALEKELDDIVLGVEKVTGVKRLESLLARAGRKIVGEKNLLNLDVPIGHFRKLRAVESGNIVAYSARDFWMEESKDFVQYLSEDGLFLIKHDPQTGRMLLADVEGQEVVYFGLDDGQLFAKKLPAQDDKAYRELMVKTRTHLGLSGGLSKISVRGFSLTFSKEKANVVFGKYQARYLPGIEDETLGTEELMEELLMFKHFAYKTRDYELKPGAILVLNVPVGEIQKSKELEEKVGGFWEAYNQYFLDMTVENKDLVNVVLVSDPRKQQVLRILQNNRYSEEPTIFARELKQLSELENLEIHYLNNQIIKFNEINLSFF